MSYLKNYLKDGFKFSGRTNRKDFWMTILYVALAFVALIVLGYVIGVLPKTISNILGLLWIIVLGAWVVVCFICDLALTTRRLHDTNHDGIWLVGAIFIPLFWIVVLIFCCMDSVNENNKY